MADLLAHIAQPGDRWEVGSRVTGDAWPLDASWDMLLDAGETVALSGPAAGQSASAHYDPEQHALRGEGLSGLALSTAGGTQYLVLESAVPPRFRVVAEAESPVAFPSEVMTDRGIPLAFSPDDLSVLRQPPAPRPTFDLSRRAAEFAASPGFDNLISLPLLHDVDLYPHQLKTVTTVLRRFRGRALLCDEVGLGKTIEAGMILLELLMRKLARRVLILTPPSLIEQWRGEMSRKFGLDFITHDDEAFKALGAQAWASFDRILASYHTARREPHRAAIADQDWDTVIVDEAHHCRNRNTLLWKLVNALRTRYMLLLTATPVQNNLEELYNLVTLLQPGLLSTARHFQRQFVDRRDKLTPRPQMVDQLHTLLAEAMVRNRRSTVAVRLTRRFAQTLRVAPLPAEQALYADVTRFVKGHLRREDSPLTRMALITLQKELGSSGLAAGATLDRLAQAAKLPVAESQVLSGLAERARRQIESAKVERLLALLRDFPDKIVVFTQFRMTQAHLFRVLSQAGDPAALFHGGLSRLEKEQAIRAFQGQTRILLSTESGSEGRNLQFCHAICNFDLPWNPMRIEQRIGRLSRIGQTRDVHVFNLVSAGTIEADLLHLLEAKINMFELVIGEIEMILGNLDEEREFEDIIFDLWAQSEDEDQFGRRMEELGRRMIDAKQAYLRQHEYDDRLFGDRFAPKE
ncbi:MAG TPA: SNF2-related protein [Anaerolineae bacterium]|nr:SNF2-related protein [Anaerolineae bacterium]